jgi:hypothetical protein
VRRLPLLVVLAACAFPVAAPARADAAARIAAEMEGPARQSLLARCGRDPRCAAYSRQAGAEPAIQLSNLSCREGRKERLRTRRCSFATQSAGRRDRLTCTIEFHEVPGDRAQPWSDRRLVKPNREYLPTSGLKAPIILGASTLACSGSLADYAG